MAVLVALIRGINVGGHKRMKMDALKGLCGRLGFEQPRTLLQSGNLVFRADRSAADAAKALEAGIAETFGFQATVIVREAAALDAVIETNPFPDEAAADAARVVAVFLAGEPAAGAGDRLTATIAGPEQAVVAGDVAYIHYPDGQGRSKLTNVAIEKALGVAGTARNWSTVTKLAALAADAAG